MVTNFIEQKVGVESAVSKPGWKQLPLWRCVEQLNEWMFGLLLFSELLSWEGKRSLQGCWFSLRRRCSGFGWERCGIELLVGSCLSVICILSVDLLPTSLVPKEQIILVAKMSDSNTFSLFKDRHLYIWITLWKTFPCLKELNVAMIHVLLLSQLSYTWCALTTVPS